VSQRQRSEEMRYLITGATGDVGSRVVRHLLNRNVRPRVLVRSGERARTMFRDQVEVHVGDLADRDQLRKAMEGMNLLYLVNVGPEIPARDELAAGVAREANLDRIVKLSSLDVEHGLAIGAWHEKGEAAIRAAGVPFTFIRPTGFMTNLLAWADSIRTECVVRSSTADGRRPFIHPEDIAEVSVTALLNEEYAGRVVSLTGPASLSFGDATRIISEAIGKPLVYQTISDEEARERYSRISGSEEETEAHVALWRAIREGRLGATTDEVEQILGRQPIPLEHWAVANRRAFRG
jgi:uncharacterized protein YbjT (DUF2867 family)